MSQFELQIKQIVDYPRCRIYRQFVQSLIQDRNIRTCGDSGLFYYTVLCSFANFRTSYRRIDGTRYTVYPGEWVCTIKEISQWFRTKFQHQVLNVMSNLQSMGLLSFLSFHGGKVIKYKITGWRRHNTVLDYNCPCQKGTGFFFLPIDVASQLIRKEHCSEMDIVLDLWISAIYNDSHVQGSEVGPVVYIRNGTGSPLVSYAELSKRWSISRSTVGRVLKKLERLNYISLLSFQGTTGSVIYLQNYLSTMFQISDVLIDKEEVAMVLNIKIELPCCNQAEDSITTMEHEVTVPNELSSVSKSSIEVIVGKVAKLLDSQGLSCFRCHKSRYMLFSLSNDCPGDFLQPMYESHEVQMGLSVFCGQDKLIRSFELTLCPMESCAEGRL